jgi:hypothetical protein
VWNTVAYTNSYSYCGIYSNSHRYRHGHSYSYIHTSTELDGYGHSHSYGDGYRDSHRDADLRAACGSERTSRNQYHV